MTTFLILSWRQNWHNKSSHVQGFLLTTAVNLLKKGARNKKDLPEWLWNVYHCILPFSITKHHVRFKEHFCTFLSIQKWLIRFVVFRFSVTYILLVLMFTSASVFHARETAFSFMKIQNTHTVEWLVLLLICIILVAFNVNKLRALNIAIKK